MKLLFLILNIFFFLAGCSQGGKEEIVISAAASLQNALSEIKAEYENEHNTSILFNFGGSGTLATQISQGAAVDLFFSASLESYDELEQRGLIKEGIPLLGNELVLITNQENSFTSIHDAESIAIGIPGSVPAGTYAKQTIEALGLWDELESKLIFTKDVSQALTYVETNHVDMAYVYKTDTLESKKVTIIETVDSSLHNKIIYPLALLSDRAEAKSFYQFLQSEEALAIFERYGFTVL